MDWFEISDPGMFVIFQNLCLDEIVGGHNLYIC